MCLYFLLQLGWGQSIRMGEVHGGSRNVGSDFPCGVDGALRDLARILFPFPFLTSSETKLRSRSAGGLVFRLPDVREVVVLISSTVKKGGVLQLLIRLRLALRP